MRSAAIRASPHGCRTVVSFRPYHGRDGALVEPRDGQLTRETEPAELSAMEIAAAAMS